MARKVHVQVQTRAKMRRHELNQPEGSVRLAHKRRKGMSEIPKTIARKGWRYFGKEGNALSLTEARRQAVVNEFLHHAGVR